MVISLELYRFVLTIQTWLNGSLLESRSWYMTKHEVFRLVYITQRFADQVFGKRFSANSKFDHLSLN